MGILQAAATVGRILRSVVAPPPCGARYHHDLTWLLQILGLERAWLAIVEWLYPLRATWEDKETGFIYHDRGGHITSDLSTFDICEPAVPGPCRVLHQSAPYENWPAYVRRLHYWLTRAQRELRDLGFTVPSTVTVTLWPMASLGKARKGVIEIDDQLSPDTLAAMAAHEYFHCVQREYVPTNKAEADAWFEGGAVACEDFFADRVNRYLHTGRLRILQSPEDGLRQLSYGAALFWHYLDEQLAPPKLHASLRLCQELAPHNDVGWPDLIEAIDGLDGVAFTRFRQVDGFLFSSQTWFGSFGLALLLKDQPGLQDPRFELLENGDPYRWSDRCIGYNVRKPKTCVLPDRTCRVGAVKTVSLAMNGSTTGPSNRLSHGFYATTIPDSVRSIEVSATKLDATLAHIVLFTKSGVHDLIRAPRASSYRKVIPCGTGSSRLVGVALVLGRTYDDGPSCRIRVSEAQNEPDVMITNWNARAGQEIEVPAHEYHWTSPDIWVEADSQGDQHLLTTGIDNPLRIRVRNKGAAPATGIAIALRYATWSEVSQHAEHKESSLPVNWRDVRDSSGELQSASGIPLAQGESTVVHFAWAPADLGANRVCLAVSLSCAQVNSQANQRALARFKVRPTEVS